VEVVVVAAAAAVSRIQNKSRDEIEGERARETKSNAKITD
jgi:hypothetical protein